jgi:hypothetical protein
MEEHAENFLNDQKPLMNVDIQARFIGDKILYTGPHVCLSCANNGHIVTRYLHKGDLAPLCDNCGTSARWEP